MSACFVPKKEELPTGRTNYGDESCYTENLRTPLPENNYNALFHLLVLRGDIKHLQVSGQSQRFGKPGDIITNRNRMAKPFAGQGLIKVTCAFQFLCST